MIYADAPETLEGVENIPGEVLSCAAVAKVLRANPAALHAQATENPTSLGFPVIVHGTRVKIPKRAFIAYMKGGLN